MQKSLNELIACAQREAAMRKAFYPKRVAAGKMDKHKANHELACMEDIVEMLQGVKADIFKWVTTDEKRT